MYYLPRQRLQREVETVRALGDVQGVYGGVEEERRAMPALQEADLRFRHGQVAELDR